MYGSRRLQSMNSLIVSRPNSAGESFADFAARTEPEWWTERLEPAEAAAVAGAGG